MQTHLNNVSNAVIKLLANEINYEFKLRNILSLNSTESNELINIVEQRLKYRQEVANIIVLANIKTKIYYNAKYQLLLLRAKDKVYLRLYHDYQLFERFSKKLSKQRCDSFTIKRRVNRFVYELELSNN